MQEKFINREIKIARLSLQVEHCVTLVDPVHHFVFSYYTRELTITHDYFTLISPGFQKPKYEISSPPEVKHVSTQTTRDHLRPIQSQRLAAFNTNECTSGWYTPDVAPSTLLFLAGPKDFLEDNIPELGRFKFQFCVVSEPMSDCCLI